MTAARMLATIDHPGGGRVGWNAVTSVSDGEARNFGADRHLGHDERHRKSEEFVALVRNLWDSWDDDRIIRDQASGLHGDSTKLRYLDHGGEWFKVRGPLNVPQPPQGQPVQIRAGVSSDFERTALGEAEVVFSLASTFDRPATRRIWRAK